jgi:hypothetical protein
VFHRSWLQALFILCICLILASCAHRKSITPIAEEDRIPIILETTDLTGTGADSLLDAPFQTVLEETYLSQVTKRKNREFADWDVRVAANPFRADSKRDATDLIVSAEMERAEYGPTLEIEVILAGWGASAAWIGESKDLYFAAVQYRYEFEKDGVKGTGIARAVAPGNVHTITRRELMVAAHQYAAYELAYTLAQDFDKKKIIKLPHQRYVASSREDAEVVGLDTSHRGS